MYYPELVQVKQEAAGKIIIYERVREQSINLALDTSFHRIENMMFIKKVKKTESGEFHEEEYCD